MILNAEHCCHYSALSSLLRLFVFWCYEMYKKLRLNCSHFLYLKIEIELLFISNFKWKKNIVKTLAYPRHLRILLRNKYLCSHLTRNF